MAETTKTGLLAKLAQRREIHAAATPAIRWRTWAAITTLLVLMAMLLRDGALTLAARTEPEWLRTLGEKTTHFGKSGWILWLSAFIFVASLWAYKKARHEHLIERGYYWAVTSAYMFLSVALSGILANLIKRAIGRARPPLFDEFGAFHFQPFSGALYESLPSGHSTTDGAIAFVLAALCPKYRPLILVIGFFFATTRVIVGAHYLSDVIAGYSFGLWYAYMSAIVFARHGFTIRPFR